MSICKESSFPSTGPGGRRFACVKATTVGRNTVMSVERMNHSGQGTIKTLGKSSNEEGRQQKISE